MRVFLCNAKKIFVSGIAAGIVILLVGSIVNYLVQFVFPYNIFELGGMRSIDDPLMMLFFLHPFVLAFALAVVYSFVQGSFNLIAKKSTT
jgi:hypothetical protein